MSDINQTTKAKTTNSELIVKSNYLVESSYKVSLVELKLLSKLTSKINKNDEDFKNYTFNVKELVDEFKLWKNNHKEIDIASEKLLSRTLTIQKDDNTTLKINFLSSCEYKKNEAIIELSFDPKLKPYLLQLKTFFTSYHLKNITSLKSAYSIRIYELLKQYETIWERIFKLEDLKRVLWIKDDMYQYGMFKKRILLNAQNELLKNSDISFKFEEIKEWRKVTQIKFIIFNDRKEKATALKPTFISKDEQRAKQKQAHQNKLYQEQDLKTDIEVQQIKVKKLQVTKWIKENKNEFEKIEAQCDWDYLQARIFIEKKIL